MEDAIEPILDFATNATFAALPTGVVETTKRFLLDTAGLMIAGIRAPGCSELLTQFQAWGGRAEATVFVSGTRLPAPAAALANALLAHAFDFDDTHEKGDMHGYAVVVPAVLAAAEREGGVSGRNIITAVAVGIDIAYRMGVAIKRYRGWHPTATCGVFGAALGAARVIGLDRALMHNAVGIAYSFAAGNFQCILDGSLTKRTQPAFAARSGVEAAIFAQRGLTGAKKVLEGKFGFYSLYESGDYDREALIDGLGSVYETEQASMKPYPSCRFCHGAVDAVLEMVAEQDLTPSDIDTVAVTMPSEAYAYVGGPYRPSDSPQVTAQFNTAYNVAAAIVRQRLSLEEFGAESVLDPALRTMADKIETIAVDDPYCFGPQEVVMRLKNGSMLSKRVTTMKGHPANPLSATERLTKVRDCLAFAGFAPSLADRLADFVARLDSSPDPIAELVEITRERPTPLFGKAEPHQQRL